MAKRLDFRGVPLVCGTPRHRPANRGGAARVLSFQRSVRESEGGGGPRSSASLDRRVGRVILRMMKKPVGGDPQRIGRAAMNLASLPAHTLTAAESLIEQLADVAGEENA